VAPKLHHLVALAPEALTSPGLGTGAGAWLGRNGIGPCVPPQPIKGAIIAMGEQVSTPPTTQTALCSPMERRTKACPLLRCSTGPTRCAGTSSGALRTPHRATVHLKRRPLLAGS
jgi:hypothetical protein